MTRPKPQIASACNKKCRADSRLATVTGPIITLVLWQGFGLLTRPGSKPSYTLVLQVSAMHLSLLEGALCYPNKHGVAVNFCLRNSRSCLHLCTDMATGAFGDSGTCSKYTKRAKSKPALLPRLRFKVMSRPANERLNEHRAGTVLPWSG